MKPPALLLFASCCLVAGCAYDAPFTCADPVVDDDAFFRTYTRREVVVTRPVPAARTERRVTRAPNPNFLWIIRG